MESLKTEKRKMVGRKPEIMELDVRKEWVLSLAKTLRYALECLEFYIETDEEEDIVYNSCAHLDKIEDLVGKFPKHKALHVRGAKKVPRGSICRGLMEEWDWTELDKAAVLVMDEIRKTFHSVERIVERLAGELTTVEDLDAVREDVGTLARESMERLGKLLDREREEIEAEWDMGVYADRQ